MRGRCASISKTFRKHRKKSETCTGNKSHAHSRSHSKTLEVAWRSKVTVGFSCRERKQQHIAVKVHFIESLFLLIRLLPAVIAARDNNENSQCFLSMKDTSRADTSEVSFIEIQEFQRTFGMLTKKRTCLVALFHIDSIHLDCHWLLFTSFQKKVVWTLLT